MGICYIVSAGDMFSSLPRINKEDLLIAADAGYLHLKKQGIEPDILIGDFDSMEEYSFKGEVKRYPVEKDDTDTLLAVKTGFRRGYETFYIYGGLGGRRTDHTLANLQTLGYIAERGGQGFLVGQGESFTVIKNGEVRFDENTEGGFSVFAFGGYAEGVTVKGAKYELENGTLSPCFPIGVSNQFTGKETLIRVKEGYLLIALRDEV